MLVDAIGQAQDPGRLTDLAELPLPPQPDPEQEEETRWAEWVEAEAEQRQSEAIERDQMRVIGSAVTRQIELAQQVYYLEVEKKLLERWLTRLEENPETVAGLDLDPSFLERRLRHQRHTTVQRISELEKSRRRIN